MDDIENESPYCPDCGSCGEMGCCSFDCEKCRNSDSHWFDMDLPENQKKTAINVISYYLDEVDLEWKSYD